MQRSSSPFTPSRRRVLRQAAAGPLAYAVAVTGHARAAAMSFSFAGIDSKPRTPQREAEHLIAAAFVTPKFGEAAFARIVLVGGTGCVVVRSHRIHGEQAGPPLSDWLRANGPTVERELMAWQAIPAPAALKRLPQAS